MSENVNIEYEYQHKALNTFKHVKNSRKWILDWNFEIIFNNK